MKKALARNIAIVSALFAVTLSVMIVTNYFQVRSVTPLQAEVVETLKQLNEQQGGNLQLQEQIRQLDLLARRAYFISIDHLQTGVYLLLGMLAVFVVCARIYFAKEKDIPGKVVSPVDEWAVKTRARTYVVWTVGGIAAVALLFVLLTSPYLRSTPTPAPTVIVENASSGDADATSAQTSEEAPVPPAPVVGDNVLPSEDTLSAVAIAAASQSTTAVAPTDTLTAAVPTPPPSRVTSNAFRGNTGNGISTARNLPTQWNLADGTHIAWRIDNPRQGYNSPVINGNRIYLSGADNEARELYCYDLLTGKQLWKLAATDIPGSPAAMPETTADTGLAASTVATNGKQVCAIFATGDILCADTDGKRLWAKNLGVPDNHYGYASSLLMHGGNVIVQYDNQNAPRVVALNLTDGSERWRTIRKEKVTWSSPLLARVADSYQLVLMGNPAITGYNPDNGEQLWRVECLSGEVGASPCSSSGIIYGASEYSKLVAIDGSNGEVLWEATDYLPEVSSPVATDKHVYLATSYGVVADYDAQTGALTKEHELEGEFYSSPVVADGKLYLINNDGKAYIFAANDGFDLLSSFDTGEHTFATPAFTDGRIVVRTDKSIYCVQQ
ncbi:MAG: PQQ-binding-like beta-propeller repeat protein [Prevotellaceae bacterium]|nr:PQQ-binding-like beta-propeller repeat protein [Prevotellaceae bacterium]